MTAGIAGLRMLIIEDESMVGMLIEDMLGDLGCVVAGAAAQLDDAVRQVSTLEFDVAILDVNLDGASSLPVAMVLMQRGIPFVMATGYGAAGVPDALRDVPVLGKPFDMRELGKALGAALVRT